MSELTERLLAHAAMHDECRPHDDEQQGFADDLRAVVAENTALREERDALAATVAMLRSEVDFGISHAPRGMKCKACDLVRATQDPAAILAARDAKTKKEALQDAALDRLLAVGVVVYSNDIKKGAK